MRKTRACSSIVGSLTVDVTVDSDVLLLLRSNFVFYLRMSAAAGTPTPTAPSGTSLKRSGSTLSPSDAPQAKTAHTHAAADAASAARITAPGVKTEDEPIPAALPAESKEDQDAKEDEDEEEDETMEESVNTKLPSGQQILDICAAKAPALKTLTCNEVDRRITGVIVVVNEFEWRVALSFLELRGEFVLVTLNNLTAYLCCFRDVVKPHTLLLVKLPNAGGSTGAFGTQALVQGVLNHFSPRFVVTIGCAGGWDPDKHRKADVLFSTVIAPYSYRKGEENRNTSQPVHANLLHMVRAVTQANVWSAEKTPKTGEAAAVLCAVHEGAILSGDQLVVTLEDQQQLQQLVAIAHGKKKKTYLVGTQPIIGAEMEGTGIWAACHSEQVPNAIFKGVSDFCADKAEQTAEQKRDAQVRASYAAFDFFRVVFSRALTNRTLPPYWCRVQYSDKDDSNKIPELLPANAAMMPAVDKYVRFMREHDIYLKALKATPPPNLDELKAELVEVKDKLASLTPLQKRKTELELLVGQKITPAKEKAVEAATEELSVAWMANSNVVEAEVDGEKIKLIRNLTLDKVKWSAREVEKHVHPAAFENMKWQLRGDSKVSFNLFDLKTNKPIPGKYQKKRSPRTPKGAQQDAANAAAQSDDAQEDEE
jgi:nucleoside phosphorylase